jgi:hypothetical protein
MCATSFHSAYMHAYIAWLCNPTFMTRIRASPPIIASLWCLRMIRFAANPHTVLCAQLLRVWDARKGGKVCKLKGHADNIKAVRICADGNLACLFEGLPLHE